MSGRPNIRRRRVASGIALVLVLAAALVLYSQRQSLGPRLATWILHSQLGLSALGPIDFRIASLGLRHVAVRDLSLDDGSLILDRADITFSPGELLAGRMTAVALRGVTVRATRTADRVDFGRLDALSDLFETAGAAQGDDGHGEDSHEVVGAPVAVVLPFARFDLRDARLRLSGAAEQGELPFMLTMEADPGGGLTLSGTAGARWERQPGARLRADLSYALKVDAAGAVAGEGVLSTLSLTMPDLLLEADSGMVRFARSAATGPEIQARLDFSTLQAGELDLAGSALTIEHGDRRLGLSFALKGPAARDDATLSADLIERDDASLALELAGAGDLATMHRLARSVLALPDDDITGRVRLALNGRVPGRIASLPALLSAEGLASLIDKAVLTGDAEISATLAREGRQQAVLSAMLETGLQDGQITLDLAEGTRGRLTAVAFGTLLPPLPPTVRALLPEGVSIAPRDAGHRNRITARRREDGWVIRPDLALQLDGGSRARAMIEARAALHVGDAGRETDWELLLEQARLRATDLSAEGVRLEAIELDIGGWLGPDGIEGRVLLDGAVRVARPEIRGRSELTASMRVRRSPAGRLHLSVDRLGATARQVVLPDAGVAAPVMRVSTPSNSPIEVRFSPPGASQGRLSVDGALVPGKIKAMVQVAGEERQIVIEPGRLDIALATGTAGRATIRLGRSQIDGKLARVADLSASLAVVLGGDTPRLANLKLDIARIEDGRRPARVAPLRLALTGGADGRDGRQSFDGVLSASSAGLNLPFSLSLERDFTSGRLSIPATDIALGADGTNPLVLFPPLADLVTRLNGRVRLAADMPWPATDDAGQSSAMLELVDVDLAAGDVLIRGLDADLRLAGLTEPRTVRPATFSARQVRLGVAIEDVAGSLDMVGPDDLRLHALTAAFADGRIAIGPVRYRPEQTISALIRAERLDGGMLTALSKVEGLTMEGRLFGRLPVAWSPQDGISISEGRLGAEAPGIVRYSPDDEGAKLRAAGGEQVGLMLDALSNFHYTVLTVAVDGRPEDGFRVGIALKGANPDLYDGYPLEFNLNLTGQLDDIIKTGYQTYALPGRLGESLLRGLVDPSAFGSDAAGGSGSGGVQSDGEDRGPEGPDRHQSQREDRAGGAGPGRKGPGEPVREQ